MPQIWVPTNVLHINLHPGGDNSDLIPRNKVGLSTLCADGEGWDDDSANSLSSDRINSLPLVSLVQSDPTKKEQGSYRVTMVAAHLG